MIKHVVMWTIKDSSRTDNINKVQEKLEALPALIKEIRDYEIGVNIAESPAAFDIVLISSFETESDFKVYRDHPEHIKVKDFINTVRDQAVVVDFQK
ncbi:MAG: Dabb family protein [candidate division KSB1 bacterium]|nr:Dabb family protein [candidate division KSB1 bacterium]